MGGASGGGDFGADLSGSSDYTETTVYDTALGATQIPQPGYRPANGLNDKAFAIVLPLVLGSPPPPVAAKVTVTHRVEVPQSHFNESDRQSGGAWRLVSLDAGSTRTVTDKLEGTYTNCLLLGGSGTGSETETFTVTESRTGGPSGLTGKSTTKHTYAANASATVSAAGYSGTASFDCSSEETSSVTGTGGQAADLTETVTETGSSNYRYHLSMADGGMQSGQENASHSYSQTSKLAGGAGTKAQLTAVTGSDDSYWKQNDVTVAIDGRRNTLQTQQNKASVTLGGDGKPAEARTDDAYWLTVFTPADGGAAQTYGADDPPSKSAGPRDWFEAASDFAAGMGDAVSCGLTQVVRQQLGFDDVVNTSSGWYKAGGWAGSAVALGTSFANPCAYAAWSAKAIRGVAAVQGLGSAAAGAKAAVSGDPVGAALGFIGARAAFGQFGKSCFVAGTPVLLAGGATKPIEQVVGHDTAGDACDVVLTRDENNPDSPLVKRLVLQTFVRVSPVLELVVRGVRVCTTAEHPFYVVGEGWRPAAELKAGDRLLRSDGRCVSVEAVVDGGRVETVYNFEVEEHHTYFVGGDEWGFDVWVHNSSYLLNDKSITGKSPGRILRDRPSTWEKVDADRGRGWKFVDENGVERIRYMKPQPDGKWPHEKTGYFRRMNAAGQYLDAQGNVVLKDNPLFDVLTHIIPG